LREFSELATGLKAATPDQQVTLLDLGCGVGNAFWPVIEQHGESVTVQCCDFSKRAVGFVQEHKLFNTNITAKVCDLVKDEIPFEAKTAGFSWLIFVLSAIAP
jgi:methyltransferase-like protein 6